MKKIFNYILLLPALLLFQNSLAQDGDAIYNKQLHEYTLNGDGSTEYREYKEVKLLSHMSFHRLFGETFIIYDPAYQEIEINEAYTIMKDGKKVVVPENAFNEVLPRAARHAPAYNGLRELVITHTGLEVGATIYLDYTLKTKPGFMQTFMGEEFIRDVVPIREKEIVVRLPHEQELQYKVLNIRTAPEISQDEDMKVYTFRFRELPAYTREHNIDYELLPRMFFSAAKDLERAYFPFVAQEAFTYPSCEGMKKALAELKKEHKDDLPLAHAIQDMVVNEIATWNIPPEYTGFKCRTPVEVWKSNGGTPLEKTVLLATMLQLAKLPAEPVAIIPERYYDRKVGSLFMFEEFGVQAKVGMGERLYFSATESNSQSLAFSPGKYFLILDGAIESLRTYSGIADPSSIVYKGTFSLDEENTLAGNVDISLGNALNPYFRFATDSAYAKRWFPGAKEVEWETISQNESRFSLEVEKKAVAKEYGGYLFMELPESSHGITSMGFSYIEMKRQQPIRFGKLIIESYHYEIDLPEGYTLISPAVEIEKENETGRVKIMLKQQGTQLIADREFELKKEVIQYNEFSAFNALWEAWINPAMKALSIKKD